MLAPPFSEPWERFFYVNNVPQAMQVLRVGLKARDNAEHGSVGIGYYHSREGGMRPQTSLDKRKSTQNMFHLVKQLNWPFLR